MKDHKHVLGQLAWLVERFDHNRKAARDAMESLAADADNAADAISVMEELCEELDETRGVAAGILESLREDEDAEHGDDDPDRE